MYRIFALINPQQLDGAHLLQMANNQKEEEDSANLAVNPQQSQPDERKLLFSGFLKRQRPVLSSWKDRNFKVSVTPNEEVVLTVWEKTGKGIEQIVNLSFSRLSLKCSSADKHYHFGLIVPSGKKYLLAAGSSQETKKIHRFITEMKKNTKEIELYPQNAETGRKYVSEGHQSELKLQENQKKVQVDHIASTKDSSRKEVNLEFELSEQVECEVEDYRIQPKSEEQSDEFKTVLNIEYDEPELHNPPDETPLLLDKPLTEAQIKIFDSDEGFKLNCNLSQGRLLVKKNSVIKASMILTTHFSAEDLLESFFHFELWNERVTQYKILNRIDEGIYLVYVQLKSNGFFAYPKYSYLMAAVWNLKHSALLSVKSLNPDHFERPTGLNWTDLNLFARVKNSQGDEKLLTTFLEVANEKDFDASLAFMKQLGVFQSYLKTSAKMGEHLLNWRQGRESIIF